MTIKKRKPLFKIGLCEQCNDSATLTLHQGEYLCRDCFVGDYDHEYVQQRLNALMSKQSRLAQLQENDYIENSKPKKGNRSR